MSHRIYLFISSYVCIDLSVDKVSVLFCSVWQTFIKSPLKDLAITRMVVHGQLVEPAVCLSDLCDVFLLDIVRDTRQNLWTMTYRSYDFQIV